MEEAPNKRNEVAILTNHVLVLILGYLTARSLYNCKCVCHSWNHLISESEYDKELPKIVTRFFYRSWKGKHNSPASLVNTPPCPSCSSPFRMSWSQIAATGSSSAGALGFTMLSATRWLTNGCYFRIATVLILLGFDLTDFFHFYVIEYGKSVCESVGVNIYSSNTTTWMFMESECMRHVCFLMVLCTGWSCPR
jgi:hypothetical protein